MTSSHFIAFPARETMMHWRKRNWEKGIGFNWFMLWYTVKAVIADSINTFIFSKLYL